jgi:hypothetical protein
MERNANVGTPHVRIRTRRDWGTDAVPRRDLAREPETTFWGGPYV